VQHCIEAKFADDKKTVGCSVARGTTPEEAMQSIRLEVYLRNGWLKIIETETPMGWHFWHDGQQVSVYSRSHDGQKHYALYDAASAQLVQEFMGPSDDSLLPEWAQSPAQVQDESVPVGNDYSEERTKWIANVLRQITKIEPGMKRQDLLKVFTTEGGLSTRFQRTYVYSECPYIKVNVRFKAANNEGNAVEEKPDDQTQLQSPICFDEVVVEQGACSSNARPCALGNHLDQLFDQPDFRWCGTFFCSMEHKKAVGRHGAPLAGL
jgi:hypothetical protein